MLKTVARRTKVKEKPKIVSFGIRPKKVIRPRKGQSSKVVEAWGVIQTRNNSPVVNVEYKIPGSTRTKKSRTKAVKMDLPKMRYFSWPYGVDASKKTGTYEIKVILNANRDEQREGKFKVKSK